MRRISSLFLAALIAVLPMRSFAADDGDGTTDEAEEAPKPASKKKKKAKAAEPEAAKPAAKESDAPKKAEITPKADDDETDAELAAEPPKAFPRHRYGYIAAGGFLVTGLAFAYAAQGESKRAETVSSAKEAKIALQNARTAGATTSVMFVLTGLTLGVTLLLEFIPERFAEKASLTFHF